MEIKQKLKNIEFITILYDKFREVYYKYLITDEILICRKFSKKLGRKVDLNNPVKYNDKLQWLKLNWFDPIAVQCADKYEVRSFIKDKIGEEYLNELYGMYFSVEDIDFDKLPKKFALKATHGSGMNIFCTDKDKLDWNLEKKRIRRWLRRNYYWTTREPVYKYIKPRIIIEKYLEQEHNGELRDYRFFCFNGEPKFITVDFNITNKKKTRRNLYDLDWNMIKSEIEYPRETLIMVNKPEKLDEMIRLSKVLSSDFPHARIDFYYINNRIIFGEITFFHQSGMGMISPEEFEITMGKWIKLCK